MAKRGEKGGRKGEVRKKWKIRRKEEKRSRLRFFTFLYYISLSFIFLFYFILPIFPYIPFIFPSLIKGGNIRNGDMGKEE